MKHALYPYVFVPVYKPYPWGGDRFARLLGRPLAGGIQAESWEITDRPEGMSAIVNGPLAGRTLGDLTRELGPALVGAGAPVERFPLLVKLIDARERTSLQVHPDEAGARTIGGEPKTEVWYALPGTHNGRVFAGLVPGIDRGSFEAARARGELESTLREVPLRAGEGVFIPGGRMHAIDVGCFLYEVQQNSDTTYRVHDWDRFDSGGGPRPLHLAKALAVTHWDDPGGEAIAPRWLRAIGSSTLWEVLDSEHFHVLKLALADSLELISTGESFHILYVEDGAVSVTGDGQTVELVRGTSALLPAALMISRLTVRDANGASLLVTLRGGSALRTKLIGS